ncbi:MAG: universal stress protein [Lewinellaceae bacterium]|jgi:nucleotide-binding universal stress UspA family protein|nr:universal stress protein [Phaeodactylibacter sp.]MCB0613536.1 universal stress protein [Phaeodactylibacter sp.]MCB9351491.1 universal stress protein [Lewinellaceae bacterium]
MKKILVPTDFSGNALNALLYAKELACKFDSHLTVLHTFQVIKRSDMLVSIDDILYEEAEKDMAAFLEKAPSKNPVGVKITKGDAISSIVSYARDWGASLIVMGTQGASGLKEVFMGSTTGGVIRHTHHIPVLSIPENFAPRPIQNIAFAIANMNLSGEEAIEPLRELARRFDAKVHIFHSVKDKDEADKAKLMETASWLEGLPYTFSLEEERGNLHETIKAFVKSVDADMLCLVRRKHGTIGFFERLFKTSATLQEAFHCELPLLVLHSE